MLWGVRLARAAECMTLDLRVVESEPHAVCRDYLKIKSLKEKQSKAKKLLEANKGKNFQDLGLCKELLATTPKA